MEFWGVEVKPGKPFPVVPDGDKILHLSQATLGEVKKDKANESVTIFVNIGQQKLVLGILSPEKFPQLSFDLVFEKEFELSHNCKNGSVYFCGYQTYGPEEGDEFSDLESDDEEEDLPQVNGKLVPEAAKAKAPTQKASIAKPESSEKQKVKLVDPSKDSEDDDESDDEDDESGEDDSDDESDEDMLAASDDEDESDDEEEDEETPKKAAVTKKRVNDSAIKTPVSSKKAKTETPQKTDGKKSVHVATPHPNKNAGKTPVSAKSKIQSPKSGGQFSCEPCKKSFNSDKGLESHNKAKHAAK